MRCQRPLVYPVVMGTGGRLFEEPPTMPQLELVESLAISRAGDSTSEVLEL